jgi:flagellar motor component MotA
MKNVTLSIPDDLLLRSREYALRHGTSLNQFIRDVLKTIVENQDKSTVEKLLEKSSSIAVKTKNIKWSREEIYDRKVFS